MKNQPKAESTKANATTRAKKPQPVTLIHLRDRIYAHLLGCKRGNCGLLENVRHATVSALARLFNVSEAVIRRELDMLVAAGGAGLFGDRVYPISGYRMQPVSAKPPRETHAAHRKLRTQIIAGHELTLAEGVRYGATRPMAPPANKPVTISIHELPNRIGDLPALQITVPNRNEADKLLRRFNDARNSLDGRVW